MIDIEFIKNAAKAKRMTLGELAERIGYSEPGFHRACANMKFKIDALQKLGQVLQITPESYIKDERSLKIIQALNSSQLETESNPVMENIHQIIEGERKHFEEEITHYRKQLDVKDRQIEHLMNQLELKDGMIQTVMNLYQEMGANIITDQEKPENSNKGYTLEDKIKMLKTGGYKNLHVKDEALKGDPTAVGLENEKIRENLIESELNVGDLLDVDVITKEDNLTYYLQDEAGKIRDYAIRFLKKMPGDHPTKDNKSYHVGGPVYKSDAANKILYAFRSGESMEVLVTSINPLGGFKYMVFARSLTMK